MYRTLIVWGVLIALAVSLMPGGVSARQDTLTVGLSLPTDNGLFYGGVIDGATYAAEELNIDLVVVSADNDTETELSNIESLIEQQVDVILLNPTDPELSLAAVETAVASDIPVFLLGSDVDSAETELDIVSLLTADHRHAGELAGAALCDAVKDEGTVVQLVGVPEPAEDAEESESTTAITIRERSEGFSAYMAENCADTPILPLNVVDLDHDAVVSAFSTLLESEDIAGVFGFNDQSILAAVEASIIARKNAHITFVGFDATEDAVKAIEQGRLQAVVTSDAWVLGELGVRNSVSYLSGEEVAPNLSVDVMVLNLDALGTFRTRPPRKAGED